MKTFQRDLSAYAEITLKLLPLASTGSDYGEYHRIQTGSSNSSQTGSTNNLATKTDVDTASIAIPIVVDASFSLVYMPTSPDVSFAQKFQKWRKDSGSRYNFATKNDINVT